MAHRDGHSCNPDLGNQTVQWANTTGQPRATPAGLGESQLPSDSAVKVALSLPNVITGVPSRSEAQVRIRRRGVPRGFGVTGRYNHATISTGSVRMTSLNEAIRQEQRRTRGIITERFCRDSERKKESAVVAACYPIAR
ncbi:hypothetical protein Bbelb_204260 [Branchiostoma belcheri]|nr:hypothetical protein Bbelb_204260 [Branchiostoma belcheri]